MIGENHRMYLQARYAIVACEHRSVTRAMEQVRLAQQDGHNVDATYYTALVDRRQELADEMQELCEGVDALGCDRKQPTDQAPHVSE